MNTLDDTICATIGGGEPGTTHGGDDLQGTGPSPGSEGRDGTSNPAGASCFYAFPSLS